MALTEGAWVRLSGDDFDIAQLCETFGGAEGITFEKDEHQRWWMTTDAFNGLTDGHEIESVATDLLRMLNGCAQVLWGNHRPVATEGAIAFVDANGNVGGQVVLLGSITSRTRVGILTVASGGQPAGPAPHIEWVRIAVGDPRVASALRIIGQAEPTWSELYHLLELVEAHLGQSVSDAGWLARAERRRFRRTANSRLAVGEQARHGVDFQPPANPMSIDEARAMARQLTERCLNSLL